MGLALAGLVLWILTALGGFYMLAKWVAGGGHRGGSATKLPPAVVFGHFLLAAAGLVLWIIYVIIDNITIGWIAFIVLIPVALLGFTMLARWIPTYRSRQSATVGGQAAGAQPDAQPERSFPVAVVVGHGLLAVATLVLVLLADLHIGTS
jgi:manganese efflux pump family protein